MVAVFEQKVEYTDGSKGSIDLFWPGKILVEMKSRGKDLEKAYQQALGYTAQLPRSEDAPRLILVCDFWNWDVYDLTNHAQKTSFTLPELEKHLPLFLFLAGYEDATYEEQEDVNIKAAEAMGELHDHLKAMGYTGHKLEVYLVRLLFLLFAEDTGIFDDNSFLYFLNNCTREDGSDLAPALEQLFQILDTPENERMTGINPVLARFPYVNGGLFRERLMMPMFTKDMRDSLLTVSKKLNWGAISPSIFGSMFQSVMDKDARRALGAHYTSETNILKVISPLFLNGLWAEFNKACAETTKQRATKLREFHEKLARLKFLDPACGCGNFLIVAYRELRLLELEVLKALHTDGQRVLDISDLCKVSVDQFYGVEIEEFPAQIAQVGMWLTDHQANLKVGHHFGQVFRRLPLRQSATIRNANALTTDWGELVGEGLSYIIGNPPFSGARFMSKEQKADLLAVFDGVKNAGDLDFVSAWYKKAVDLMKGTETKAALVSTNSITQGQQVALLWRPLAELGCHIDFAYRTFKWSNEAKNKAAVHCVIVGFSCGQEQKRKMLVSENGDESHVPHINGYLVAADDIFIDNRSKPLCDVPEMGMGNQPIDDGNYLFTEDEKDAFLLKEPAAAPYFHPWLGGEEFINGKPRYCLWLGKCSPDELDKLPEAMKRVEAVQAYRQSSKRASTQRLAKFPRNFQTENMPEGSYIAIPEVSSEKRDFIPIGFLSQGVLCSNKIRLVPNTTLYHFGVLTSTMHMAWTRAVCGRLKSDYDYSNKLVYNNYPWPAPTDEQRARIEACAQAVLDARALFPNSSLASLYNPMKMPPELVKAHAKLDAAVEQAYGRTFADDGERVAYLFDLYRQLTR
ncbi:MAG: N-6 DNA methylase [Akkermansia sp.]|nr:N-6 DNA methylase [Akkermansia sp.]